MWVKRNQVKKQQRPFVDKAMDILESRTPNNCDMCMEAHPRRNLSFLAITHKVSNYYCHEIICIEIVCLVYHMVWIIAFYYMYICCLDLLIGSNGFLVGCIPYYLQI